ncbi:MAG: PDZ domain-containing protein, partial [Lentisphaerae bacterium]
MIYNLIGTILMVFFFGFCIFIHEFGHLLMARAMRLFVQSFSIGFGPVLWKKVYRGIEYRLSLIPFGGYVMIPQLEPTDHPTKKDGSPLPSATPFERIMTAFAGPLANIISAFLISFVVFAIGDYREKVDPNGVEVGEVPQVFKFNGKEYEVPESKAGLRAGDIITAVNGTKITRGQRQLIREIIFAPHGKVVLDILRDGKPLQISYKLKPHPDPRFRGVGMPFFKCVRKTIIYELVAVDPAQNEPSPAARAGLKKDDVVVEVNGQRVISPGWLVEYLHNLNPDPEKKPYQAALFTIKRKANGAWRELQVKVEPAAATVKDPKTGAE